MSFYDKDNQIINISPYEGDVNGEIINLQGLKVQLPQKPSDKYILNSDKPILEQKWARIPIPEEIDVIDSWEEFKQYPQDVQDRLNEYIEEEWRRRKDGLWVYIKGRAYYLTGDYYMFLQWGKQADFDLNDGYPLFYENQWELEVHAEACFLIPWCCGQIVGKNRRYGWTSLVRNKTLCKTSGGLGKGKTSGMTSKNEDDAKEVLYEKLLYTYQNWPFFFRISYHESGSGIIFDRKKQQITLSRNNKKKSNAHGGRIRYGATKNNTFDGWALFILLADEIAKFTRPVTLKKFWDKHKPTLYDRIRVRGFAFLGTTAEEVKDHEKEGAEDYKKLYSQSDISKSVGGETKSGLIKYFCSARNSLVIDEYGLSVVNDPKKDEEVYDHDGNRILEGSKTIIAREIKKRGNDTHAINEYRRLFPSTETDMFRTMGSNSLNTEKIYTQIQYNEEQSLLGATPFRQGLFEWTGERYRSNVTFVDNSRGQWRIALFLDEEDQNKKITVNGLDAPANGWLGGGGVDPYKADQTSDGRGSSGSCHIVTRYNMKYPSNVCIARYNGRPETLYLCSEQLLMAHIYFGVPCLIEREVDTMIRHWEDLGYKNYLIKSPPHLTPKGSRNIGKSGINTSGANVREALLLALQTYVNESIGMLSSGKMGSFYFNETLYDLANFDINNATIHDDSMSLGIALLGLQTYKELKPVKTQITNLVRRFDNSGTSSRFVKPS
jgi:hypothetical protein